MDKYKINYIYSDDSNINDIFIKVLNKELNKYIDMKGKNENVDLSFGEDKSC